MGRKKKLKKIKKSKKSKGKKTKEKLVFNQSKQSTYKTKIFKANELKIKKIVKQATEKKIHQYLEKIGKQKNKKELIGILKLYGISTDWINP